MVPTSARGMMTVFSVSFDGERTDMKARTARTDYDCCQGTPAPRKRGEIGIDCAY